MIIKEKLHKVKQVRLYARPLQLERENERIPFETKGGMVLTPGAELVAKCWKDVRAGWRVPASQLCAYEGGLLPSGALSFWITFPRDGSRDLRKDIPGCRCLKRLGDLCLKG